MVIDAGGELKELHDALVNTESVDQFLHDMAVLAARLVGTDLSCGMTMRSNGRPATVACSDPVAAVFPLGIAPLWTVESSGLPSAAVTPG